MLTNEQLQMACEIGQIGTFIFNLDDMSVQWSPYLKEMFGFSDDTQVTFEMYSALVLPNELPQVEARLAAVLSGEVTTYDVEYAIIPFGDTAVKWLHVQGQVYPETKIMYGVIMDITKSKLFKLTLLSMLKSVETSKDSIQEFLGSRKHGK